MLLDTRPAGLLRRFAACRPLRDYLAAWRLYLDLARHAGMRCPR